MAEKRAVQARLIQQQGIRRADAAAMLDSAFVDQVFRRARRGKRGGRERLRLSLS